MPEIQPRETATTLLGEINFARWLRGTPIPPPLETFNLVDEAGNNLTDESGNLLSHE